MNVNIALNALIFAMAFTSLSYEFLLSTYASQLMYEGIFIYPTCLAIFICAMGLGSFRCFLRLKNVALEKILTNVLIIEFMLMLVGGSSIILLEYLRGAIIYKDGPVVLLTLLLSGIIGFLSGQELPLIFAYCDNKALPPKVSRSLIFWDYMASFFASLIFTLILFPNFGLIRTSFMIGVVNLFIILYWLKLYNNENINISRLIKFATAGSCSLVMITSINLNPLNHYLTHITLLGDYDLHGKIIKMFNTPYQQVVMSVSRTDGLDVSDSPDEILKNPAGYKLSVFLNRSLQFLNDLGAEKDAYHIYLMDPMIQIFPSIKNLLILGGGDGLPARQAATYDQLSTITMVDLDKKWLEFTRDNPLMKFNTHASLSNPKLDLIAADAFTWVAHTKKKFDLIIIDFPEDDNLAAIRTISLQFFNRLKNALSAHGMVVIQNDVTPNRALVEMSYNTAVRAGYYPLIGYRSDSNELGDFVIQMVLFTTPELRDEYLEKYYHYYLKNVKFSSLINQYSFIQYIPSSDLEHGTKKWISFYDPAILQEELKYFFKYKFIRFFSTTEYEDMD